MIIQNAIQCKTCRDIIESTSCGACSADGGHDYLRRCAKSLDDFIDLSEFKSDSKIAFDFRSNQEWQRPHKPTSDTAASVPLRLYHREIHQYWNAAFRFQRDLLRGLAGKLLRLARQLYAGHSDGGIPELESWIKLLKYFLDKGYHRI